MILQFPLSFVITENVIHPTTKVQPDRLAMLKDEEAYVKVSRAMS